MSDQNYAASVEALYGGTSNSVLVGGGASAAVGQVAIGTALQVFRVNAGATGLEFATLASASGDVVGPASATDNAIARFDGTTGKLVQDSLVTISDAGAVVATGTLAAPSFSFAGNTSTGIYNRAAYRTSFAANGAVGVEIDNGGVYVASTATIYFLTGAIGTGTDLSLVRSGANLLKVTNGGAGNGAIIASQLGSQAYTVGTLPSAATWDGYTTRVTDANVAASGNYGATVAGGGANKVKVFSDGTNWVIA